MNCPACQASDSFEFHHAEAVPAHVVRLLRSREEALAAPCGRIVLACCRACGFIWNSAFDRGLLDYGVVDNVDSIDDLFLRGVRPIVAVSSQFREIARVLVAYNGSMASAKAMSALSAIPTTLPSGSRTRPRPASAATCPRHRAWPATTARTA